MLLLLENQLQISACFREYNLIRTFLTWFRWSDLSRDTCMSVYVFMYILEYIRNVQSFSFSLFLALDCKQKKSRSRSGSKKKMLTLPHGADEVYILRCRYVCLFYRPVCLVSSDFALRDISYFIRDF